MITIGIAEVESASIKRVQRYYRCTAKALIYVKEKESHIKTLMKRSLMVGGAVTSIGIASIGSAGLVSAATNSSTDNPTQSIVDSIATKFNLNKDEVQKVFDENHEVQEAKHEKMMEERLADAVKAGKLTQEQADKLSTKLNEMHEARKANREEFKNKTPAERKAARQAERDAFKQWLADNNIPEESAGPMEMRGMRGEGRGHHGGMRMHDDNMQDQAESSIN